jgi:drug/metabolite transporter (DMT)-like permease
MQLVFVWTIIFSLSTAVSIVLLGDRSLISGNLFEQRRILYLIFHIKFVLAIIFALIARVSFIFINNLLLKIDRFSDSSTTVTAFITAVSFVVIIIMNAFYLHEKLSLQQLAGAFFIMAGTWIMLK